MTPEELRLLLDVHSEGYLRALESMMKEWRTRYDSIEEKCHKMEKAHENEIRELKRSLEYSQKDIDDLKEEIKQLKTMNEDNSNDIDDLDKRTIRLDERANYQEDASRRDNIRIDGINEEDGETWGSTAEKVVDLLKNQLDMPHIDINAIHRAHRTGKRTRQPRTIVAKMTRFCDRDQALRNGHRLKGTDIRISEDLCAASFQKRVDQWDEYIAAKKNKNKIAYFNYTKLVIRDRRDAATPDDEATDGALSHGDTGSRSSSPNGSHGGGRGGGHGGNRGGNQGGNRGGNRGGGRGGNRIGDHGSQDDGGASYSDRVTRQRDNRRN